MDMAMYADRVPETAQAKIDQHIMGSILHDGIQSWLWLIAPRLLAILAMRTASCIVIVIASIAPEIAPCCQLAILHA